MTLKKVFLAGMLFILVGLSAHAQKVAIKSNLLYDATTTANLGMEFKLGSRTTFDLPVNYNGWSLFKDDNGKGDNKKWMHFLVQPELRFWTCESFTGHFWGIHGHYAYFNAGGFGPLKQLKDHRFEGWLAGAGLSYGYNWMLSPRWSIEATIGLGYAFIDYEKFECYKCGEKLDEGTYHYFGPTKVGISLIYFLK